MKEAYFRRIFKKGFISLILIMSFVLANGPKAEAFVEPLLFDKNANINSFTYKLILNSLYSEKEIKTKKRSATNLKLADRKGR